MKFLFAFLVTFLSLTVHAGNVTFAGSSTIMPIMEDMQSIFEKNGLHVNVQGGGSSAGIKSVKMGMAEVGMVSRSLSESEAKTYKKLTLAKDWVVIIANSENPLNDITHSKVVDLFTNPNNNEFHLVAKEDGRATKKVFDNYFNLTGKLRKDLTIIGANGQAIATVEKDPSAIAYVSYSAAIEALINGSKIKVLSLDGIDGTASNVLTGKYQLARELNLVYLEKNDALIKNIKSILSTDEANSVFIKHNVISSLTQP